MSDVDNGDILRFGAGLSLQGVYDIVNVWYVRADFAVGHTWADVTPWVQSYMEAIYDELNATLSDLIGTNVISVANVTQDTTIGVIAWSPTWAGADTSEVTAPGVCCFAWGRTYKPRVQIRKYFGVFGEGNMADGVWSAAVQAAVKAALQIHIDAYLPVGGAAFKGIAYNRALATWTEAVSVDASAEPAYQRRRKRGRGS